jgi:amidophosphoribosyltransferase
LLVRNRYVGRSFIQPDQSLRRQGVRLKFSPLEGVISGKRLVVVDDSIVRGTTMGQVVEMLKDAGATEVHLRVSSPPVLWPCFYGIDMADREQLIAANHDVEEIAEITGATSLAYLSLDGLQSAIGTPASGYCRACLTGEYPIALPESADKLRFEADACGSVGA